LQYWKRGQIYFSTIFQNYSRSSKHGKTLSLASRNVKNKSVPFSLRIRGFATVEDSDSLLRGARGFPGHIASTNSLVSMPSVKASPLNLYILIGGWSKRDSSVPLSWLPRYKYQDLSFYDGVFIKQVWFVKREFQVFGE